MSTRRTSTMAAVAISVLMLAVLVLSVALGSGGGKDDKEGATRDGVPSGFERIADDVFFERILGAQRTAGSWHFEQETVLRGVTTSTLSADTEMGEGEPAHAATIERINESGSTDRYEVVVVDGIYYAKGLGSDKPWWRIDPQASQLAADAAKQLAPLISQDSSEDLGESVQSTKVVGPDSVDGVETVHYRLVLGNPEPAVPPSSATDAPPPAVAYVDVWVDAHERPVRMVVKVGDAAEQLATTTTYSRYGEDLPIAEPPADQVTDTPPRALTEPPSGKAP